MVKIKPCPCKAHSLVWGDQKQTNMVSATGKSSLNSIAGQGASCSVSCGGSESISEAAFEKRTGNEKKQACSFLGDSKEARFYSK